MKTDIFIVGSGCGGLYCALQLPIDKQITVITKSDLESSDSFLAQGGMCMLKDESDYDSYMEDTMRAGHYENDRTAVDIMIRSSQSVVGDLLDYGVAFDREPDGSLAFTREGAHSEKRILFHKDITGREITGKLLAQARRRPNITLLEHTALVDIVARGNTCYGGIIRHANGQLETVEAGCTVLATGGIGGLYRHSTNFRHLTGDALAIAANHNIALKHINYVQIHPTTFYDPTEQERSFLISESVRGEGAKLYDKHMCRFVNELLPRDRVTAAIRAQMQQDHTDHVWEDLRSIPAEELERHFPNIVAYCLKKGYDVTKVCVPVVPAQHYFMGGIQVDYDSRTSMAQLYAVGETACTGVHGKNRLASNSLLEALVFAGRAARDIAANWSGFHTAPALFPAVDLRPYEDSETLARAYQAQVRSAIENANKAACSA